jgi:hypothetical protein
MTTTLNGALKGILAGSLVWTCSAATGAEADTLPTEFNRDIRPLFAKHCTACHGGVKNAGKISFVYREKALAKGKSGKAAIVPGHPEDSELIRRVTTQDPDDLMPKPDHGPRLTEREVDVLRRWIREGAVWSEHWSFVAPKEPPKPQVKDTAWPRTSADAFILATLEAEGLRPSPEAPAQAWLRRVSLDLTGLPPTPEQFETFMADRARDPEKARERVVDQLLASPSFGERWAAVWLDLARYSDTYGFEKDPHRDIWPWRDWVIRAFNSDLPFDQFTIRQLAGDLLESPTADDLLATAFHRNTQNNTEGGTDDEEYRTVAVLDRVNTTWTVWQATTFGCVQCHAHPYDPFPQQDYYRFAAFFDNSEDCDQDDDFPRYVFPSDPGRREEVAKLQIEARQRREALNAAGLSEVGKVTEWRELVPLTATSTGSKLEVGPDGRIDATGTQPISAKYTLRLPLLPGMTALRIDIFPEGSNPKRPPERGQIFSKITASVVPQSGSNMPVRLKEAIADYLAGPFDPQRVVQGGGGLGSYPVLTGPRQGVIVLEKPLEGPEGAVLQIELEHGIASNDGFQGCPLKHFAFTCTKDPRLTDLVNSPARVAEWKAWRSAIDRLNATPGTRVPVMVERARPAARETRVFIRGNRLTRDDVVQPGIPGLLNPPQKTGLNRLDMARWLVSDANPLAARVLANRLWAEMFGRGIVETLEDFGVTGAKPTHPELLDHLALKLRAELGWSVKRFLRMIALSSTYAQDSRATPALLERDPANRLLARGPRSRLTAEMVRDQALTVSGLLVPTLYGPPVFPPQPEGVWRTVYNGATWVTARGEDRFRRALYTYCRRTSGYPLFLTFDGPTRDGCTARRVPSNTPLQALTTWNDPAFIEMAQALAGRMQSAAGSAREKVAYACRQITLAEPPRAMVDTLVHLYEQAHLDYLDDPESSAQLGDTAERAALTLVANTILNLDQALTR